MSTILSYKIALKARDYPAKYEGLIDFLDPYIDEIDAARQGEDDLLAAFGLYVAKSGLTANLAAGGFRITGLGAPVAGGDAVNRTYADSLSFAAALPAQAGQDGKVARTLAGVTTWDDWFGPPTALNAAGALARRVRYHGDSTGGGFSVNLPTLAGGGWVLIIDVKRSCGLNNITLVPNGADKVYGVNQNYVMDVDGECLLLVPDATEGWVRACL